MICPECGAKMKFETELGITRWRCACDEMIEYKIGG